VSIQTSFMGEKSVTHLGGMGIVPNALFRMRDMGNIVVGSTVAVVQESIRKVAAWATYGGVKEISVIGSGGAVHQCSHTPTGLTWANLLNSSTSTSRFLFLIITIYTPSPAPSLSSRDPSNLAN